MSIRIRWPSEGWPDEINEAIRSKLENVIRRAMANAANPNTNTKSQNSNNTEHQRLASSLSNSKSDSRNSTQHLNQSSKMMMNATSQSDRDELLIENDLEENHHDHGDHDDNDDEDEEECPPLLSTLVRGVVTIEQLSLGKVAPKITLKRILELSPGRSGLVVRVEYCGDAFMSLRGIDLNLDPSRAVVPGGGGLRGARGAEFVSPNFVPLALTLSDLHISGDLKIEVYHEQEEIKTTEKNDIQNQNQETRSTATFVPDTFTEMFLGKLGLGIPTSANNKNSSSKNAVNNSNTTKNSTRTEKTESKIRRKLFIQLVSQDEFLKDFNAVFPAPEAIEIIKKMIQTVSNQFFQGLRTRGLTVSL